MTLFRLDASIRAQGSHSREIADVVQNEWLATHPHKTVVRRQIGIDPLPADAWASAVSATSVAESNRTPKQIASTRLATTLVDELLDSDVALLAIPLYNYGVSQHAKTWFDLIFTDPRAGNGSIELLSGKPVVLVTVRGGAYGSGTPREGWDHSTGYLKRILGDVCGADLTVIEREFTMVGVIPSLSGFQDKADQMHEAALGLGRQVGKALV